MNYFSVLHSRQKIPYLCGVKSFSMSNYPTIAAMTAAQRKEYEAAVSAWLSNPSDIAVGLRLLQPLPQAKVFLGYAKCYAEDRKRKEIIKLLRPIAPSINASSTRGLVDSSTAGAEAPTAAASSASSHPQSPLRITTPAGTVYNYDEQGNIVSVGGLRPNHYDEWKQMMPAVLQDKVDQLDENYANMVAWRRKLEALVADPKSSKADISRAATLTRNYEAKNLNIFAQAEVCWEELCGKTVDDATKQELAQEEARIAKEISKEESSAGAAHPNTSPLVDSSTRGLVDSSKSGAEAPTITAEQAQKYIRDKFDPSTASPEQIQKALDYAAIIMKEKGKLSKKVQAKIDSIPNLPSPNPQSPCPNTLVDL